MKGSVEFICLLLTYLVLRGGFFSPLYITDINPLSNEQHVKIFSNSVICLFNPLTISFTYRSLLIRYANAKSCFFSLNNWNFSQVNSSILILENLFPMFSLNRFKSSGFTLRHLIYFELIFKVRASYLVPDSSMWVSSSFLWHCCSYP